MRAGVLVMVLALMGCGGDDGGESTSDTGSTTPPSSTGTGSVTGAGTATGTGGTSTGTGGTTATGGTTGTSAPSLSTIQPLFSLRCGNSCHLNGSASGGLRLDYLTYGELVANPATGLPTMDRVTPGDLSNSYLWHKLQGTHAGVGGVGSQMPQGDSLNANEMQAIEDWIVGGALP